MKVEEFRFKYDGSKVKIQFGLIKSIFAIPPEVGTIKPKIKGGTLHDKSRTTGATIYCASIS